jgi:hypothetical protein
MKLAIMQPYFLPYIGYFQLIASVDKFVIYDNIKYTKKGWINRNRYLQNGKDSDFTIPLKKDSDFLDVRDRAVASDFNKPKMINKFIGAYRKAPYFDQVIPLIEHIVHYKENNLFWFIENSIRELCSFLQIGTEIVVSSTVAIDHSLKAQDKVLAICEKMGADIYINAIGGQVLYSREDFMKKAIDLKFIKANYIEYKQFDSVFVPWLSILDVMMFNSKESISEMLHKYQLI